MLISLYMISKHDNNGTTLNSTIAIMNRYRGKARHEIKTSSTSRHWSRETVCQRVWDRNYLRSGHLSIDRGETRSIVRYFDERQRKQFVAL